MEFDRQSIWVILAPDRVMHLKLALSLMTILRLYYF